MVTSIVIAKINMRHIHLAVPFESRPGSDLRAASIGFDDYLRVWGDRSLK
jgi:hypothetical protein